MVRSVFVSCEESVFFDTGIGIHSGGLLIDFGVLTLRPNVLTSECYPDDSGIPRLPPSHPAVVEWRAMTVIEL